MDRKEIRWRLPKKDWVKINFDGASKGNRGISGAGAIAWNDRGEIIGVVEKRLVDGSNNVTEVEAALIAASLGGKLDVVNLHIEGDSKLVVDAIVKGATKAWFFQNHIQIIK